MGTAHLLADDPAALASQVLLFVLSLEAILLNWAILSLEAFVE